LKHRPSTSFVERKTSRMSLLLPGQDTAQPDIRPFVPADLPALQEIRRAAFAPMFESFRTIVGESIASIALADADAEQAKLLDTICAPDAPHEIFTVVTDGQIAGFVSWSHDAAKKMGEIGLNAVHPRYAGRGIGAWMYRFVLERMKEKGVAIATVGTGGDPSHAAARRAYEKAGFGPAIPSVYLYKAL